MAYRLRAARAADAEAIAVLHTDSWRRTYRGMMPDAFLDGDVLANRRQVWHERLAMLDPRRLVSVAMDDDQLAGFICTVAGEDPVWGAFIDNLHVAAARHGQGIGRALMQGTARWLRDSGDSGGVYLWVMEANAGARRLYERLGAANAGTVIKEDPGGGRAPNCRYVWPRVEMLLD